MFTWKSWRFIVEIVENKVSIVDELIFLIEKNQFFTVSTIEIKFKKFILYVNSYQQEFFKPLFKVHG